MVGDKSYEPRLARGGEGEGEEEGGRNFLHCINLVRKQDDPTVRRGAVVKAMCICSRYNYIEVGPAVRFALVPLIAAVGSTLSMRTGLPKNRVPLDRSVEHQG